MKKVIFVCLLTLSVCLSEPPKPVETPALPTVSPHEEAKPNPVAGAPPKAPPVPVTPTQAPANPPVTTASPVTEKTNDTKTNETTTISPAPVVPPTNTSNNSTDDKSKTTSTTAKPADHTTVTPLPVSTTEKAPTGKPNNTATTEKPPLQARGFDGASFVGGIILTLGLLAIGFMGFKYYKAQTERNYHTL